MLASWCQAPSPLIQVIDCIGIGISNGPLHLLNTKKINKSILKVKPSELLLFQRFTAWILSQTNFFRENWNIHLEVKYKTSVLVWKTLPRWLQVSFELIPTQQPVIYSCNQNHKVEVHIQIGFSVCLLGHVLLCDKLLAHPCTATPFSGFGIHNEQ